MILIVARRSYYFFFLYHRIFKNCTLWNIFQKWNLLFVQLKMYIFGIKSCKSTLNNELYIFKWYMIRNIKPCVNIFYSLVKTLNILIHTISIRIGKMCYICKILDRWSASSEFRISIYIYISCSIIAFQSSQRYMTNIYSFWAILSIY